MSNHALSGIEPSPDGITADSIITNAERNILSRQQKQKELENTGLSEAQFDAIYAAIEKRMIMRHRQGAFRW